MLVTPDSERDATIDRRLAVTLASIAGGLNAAAFYAVGFFSANMTGNVSALSDRLATGALPAAWLYLAIVLAFVCGAAASAALVAVGERQKRRGVYAGLILIEGVLLAPLAIVDLRLGGALRVDLLATWLAFLMGLQNAVVTQISHARVRTTHVSGMATDLGIEIAVALAARHLSAADRKANAVRLRLHLTTILAFLLGGVVGVVLYRLSGGWVFLVSAVLLCAVGAGGMISSARRDTRK